MEGVSRLIKSTVSKQDFESGNFVRNSEESELHKKIIRRIARSFKSSGYRVKADHITEFEYPDRYRMIKPDVVAEKSGSLKLVEVETRSSIGTRRDKLQRREFSEWAKRDAGRDFIRETVL